VRVILTGAVFQAKGRACPEPWTVLTVSGGQKQGQSYEAKYRLQQMKWLQKQAAAFNLQLIPVQGVSE
jgi:hypothetical protein